MPQQKGPTVSPADTEVKTVWKQKEWDAVEKAESLLSHSVAAGANGT